MGPLEGIKVVELGQWVAAPGAGAILSDWGAEVVKIENPSHGDPYRGYVETRSDYPKMAVSGTFELSNRNKRGVAINLQHEAGQEIAHRLVKEADIFITNLRVKALQRLRMDYDSLAQINSKLIYGTVTGYGEAGPDKDAPGFDRTAYFAGSGMQGVLREPDADPPWMPPAFGDHAVAGFLVATILAALWAREQRGIGQKVSLSLYHCGIWQLGTVIQTSLVSNKDVSMASRKKPGNPLTNHYQTKDGRWIVLGMPPSDQYWPSFCKAIEREDLVEDPQYRSHQLRSQNAASLVHLLDEIFVTRTYAEWKDILDNHGCVYGIIKTSSEVVSDPQAWANDIFATIEHPAIEKLNLITAPGKFSKTPGTVRTAAPQLGQHTEEVLLETGYTWDDIVRFKEQGVII